jgi:hypothetical protein
MQGRHFGNDDRSSQDERALQQFWSEMFLQFCQSGLPDILPKNILRLLNR